MTINSINLFCSSMVYMKLPILVFALSFPCKFELRAQDLGLGQTLPSVRAIDAKSLIIIPDLKAGRVETFKVSEDKLVLESTYLRDPDATKEISEKFASMSLGSVEKYEELNLNWNHAGGLEFKARTLAYRVCNPHKHIALTKERAKEITAEKNCKSWSLHDDNAAYEFKFLDN